jgi:hypothetical protein
MRGIIFIWLAYALKDTPVDTVSDGNGTMVCGMGSCDGWGGRWDWQPSVHFGFIHALLCIFTTASAVGHCKYYSFCLRTWLLPRREGVCNIMINSPQPNSRRVRRQRAK